MVIGTKIRLLQSAALCAAVLCALGCSYHRSHAPTEEAWRTIRLAVVPFNNLTEYPHAGLIVTELWRTELGTQGFGTIPGPLVTEALGTATPRAEGVPVDPFALGKQLGVTHVAVGSVTEYRYKFGLDGEPAVGISAAIINVADGSVCWQGSASDTGFGYDSLNRVAQLVCKGLVSSIAWQE